jgi:hypothetical protein
MTCQYCSVSARHPCVSRQEAAQCGNNDSPGSCLDFNAKDVAAWIRYNARSDEKDLLNAADLIEERL